MFNTAWAGSRTLNQLVRRRCESCDGDALTYTAASSDPGVAEVAVSGASVTVMGVSAGTASLTLTDPKRLSRLEELPGHGRAGLSRPCANARRRSGTRSCGHPVLWATDPTALEEHRPLRERTERDQGIGCGR